MKPVPVRRIPHFIFVSTVASRWSFSGRQTWCLITSCISCRLPPYSPSSRLLPKVRYASTRIATSLCCSRCTAGRIFRSHTSRRSSSTDPATCSAGWRSTIYLQVGIYISLVNLTEFHNHTLAPGGISPSYFCTWRSFIVLLLHQAVFQRLTLAPGGVSSSYSCTRRSFIVLLLHQAVFHRVIVAPSVVSTSCYCTTRSFIVSLLHLAEFHRLTIAHGEEFLLL